MSAQVHEFLKNRGCFSYAECWILFMRYVLCRFSVSEQSSILKVLGNDTDGLGGDPVKVHSGNKVSLSISLTSADDRSISAPRCVKVTIYFFSMVFWIVIVTHTHKIDDTSSWSCQVIYHFPLFSTVHVQQPKAQFQHIVFCNEWEHRHLC